MNSSAYKRVVNKMRIMQHYQLWLLNWLMTTNKHISHIGAGGGWLSLIWHSSCYSHKF